LLLAQSTAGGGLDDGLGKGADGDGDRDPNGVNEGEDGDGGDGEAGVAATRCATRSVAEIGRQATTSTHMINIQRITLVITTGKSPGVDQPHRCFK
jgi:hypothetical protein